MNTLLLNILQLLWLQPAKSYLMELVTLHSKTPLKSAATVVGQIQLLPLLVSFYTKLSIYYHI